MPVTLTPIDLGSTNWGESVNSYWTTITNAFMGNETIGPLVLTSAAGNYLRLPALTSTQRDAITPAAGMMLFNSTSNQIERYQSSWNGIATSGANSDITSLASIGATGIGSSPGTALLLKATAPATAASTATGASLSLIASNATAGNTNSGAAAGGAVVITSGNAARLTSGDAAGGNITITAGNAIGNGNGGIVSLAGGSRSGTGGDGYVSSSGIFAFGGNLDPTAGYNLSFLSSGGVLGWNRSAGDGETTLISQRGAGSVGGFRFYDRVSNVDNFLMSINGNGRVGLGVGNPSYQLQLSSDSAAKPNGGSWTNSSDIRLKKNVSTISNALSTLLRLRGVEFEWKEPEKFGGLRGTRRGLIANEVASVLPEWVGEDDKGFKTLTVFGFEALVVEALRELSTKLKA
jgi:hypothetical protein